VCLVLPPAVIRASLYAGGTHRQDKNTRRTSKRRGHVPLFVAPLACELFANLRTPEFSPVPPLGDWPFGAMGSKLKFCKKTTRQVLARQVTTKTGRQKDDVWPRGRASHALDTRQGEFGHCVLAWRCPDRCFGLSCGQGPLLSHDDRHRLTISSHEDQDQRGVVIQTRCCADGSIVAACLVSAARLSQGAAPPMQQCVEHSDEMTVTTRSAR